MYVSVTQEGEGTTGVSTMCACLVGCLLYYGTALELTHSYCVCNAVSQRQGEDTNTVYCYGRVRVSVWQGVNTTDLLLRVLGFDMKRQLFK